MLSHSFPKDEDIEKPKHFAQYCIIHLCIQGRSFHTEQISSPVKEERLCVVLPTVKSSVVFRLSRSSLYSWQGIKT